MIKYIFRLKCKGTLLLILFHSLEELLAYRENTINIYDNKLYLKIHNLQFINYDIRGAFKSNRDF